MQEKWHSWLDYRWGGWLCATWFAVAWFQDRQHELDAAAIYRDRWVLLAMLFASLLPTLWSALRTEILQTQREGRAPRATWSGQVHAVLSHSFVACLLVATYGRVWNFADIGFRTASPWNWTILVGLLGYRFLCLAQSGLARWFTPAELQSTELFRRVWIGCFLPRGRIAQAVHVFESGIASPIHEEIVYRGFMVYMLGNLTGQPWLGILVGLILCVTVHLYQGFWAIPAHVLFFAIFVATMYSPAGLLTVLVMHVTYNLHHAMTLPTYVEQYLAHLRQVRQEKREST